jgi:hypothetical protein
MNLVELQKKLIAAARANAPGDEVPYAFEKRITALLASRVAPDNMSLWVHGLWRAAVAVAMICGLCSLLAPAVPDNRNDLSQDFENTLLASVDQGDIAQ